MKKQEVYQQLSKYYDNYQITELLLKETDFTKNQLFLCEELENISQQWLNKNIQGANSGHPFEYMINKSEFYDLYFYVDERTLIPRDDTEIMVSSVLNLINKEKLDKVVLIDIGTGTSCIPISILNNTDKVNETYVVDISEEALEVSKININKYKFSEKITQFHDSLLEPILKKINILNQKQIIITANLPYILDNDIKNMDKETIKYEPDTALYGGPVTGFELYEDLIQQCLELKKLGKINSLDLFIEIGFDQKEYSQNYLNNLGLNHMYHKDNGGVERCVHIVI